MIYFDFFGSNYYTVIIKYFLQTIKTCFILLRDRPDIIFVMSPSVVANIPVYLFCKIFNADYIIDAHTGAFKNTLWRRVMFLQKYFSKHALITLVTNKELAKTLIEWGADYKMVPDVPIICKNPRIPELQGDINVTLVNTFAVDEPLDYFLKATMSFPHVQFYITGKINRHAKKYISSLHNNVLFTDFLKNDKYYGLLLASDLIVVLTTKDNTMQRGAYEAIYLGKPIITSNWPLLRANFPKGAIFVDNSIDNIKVGIEKALDKLPTLAKEASLLKEKKINDWQSKRIELLTKINMR